MNKCRQMFRFSIFLFSGCLLIQKVELTTVATSGHPWLNGYDCTPQLQQCIRIFIAGVKRIEIMNTEYKYKCLQNVYCEDGSKAQAWRDELVAQLKEAITDYFGPPDPGFDDYDKAPNMSQSVLVLLVSLLVPLTCF